MPKTREGYYHYTGGVEAAIKRELAFAPYADMIWLETKLPDLQQARYFSRKIREKYPGKWVSDSWHRSSIDMQLTLFALQMVRVQPEPELQLECARLFGCGSQELYLGPREGGVSDATSSESCVC